MPYEEETPMIHLNHQSDIESPISSQLSHFKDTDQPHAADLNCIETPSPLTASEDAISSRKKTKKLVVLVSVEDPDNRRCFSTVSIAKQYLGLQHKNKQLWYSIHLFNFDDELKSLFSRTDAKRNKTSIRGWYIFDSDDYEVKTGIVVDDKLLEETERLVEKEQPQLLSVLRGKPSSRKKRQSARKKACKKKDAISTKSCSICNSDGGEMTCETCLQAYHSLCLDLKSPILHGWSCTRCSTVNNIFESFAESDSVKSNKLLINTHTQRKQRHEGHLSNEIPGSLTLGNFFILIFVVCDLFNSRTKTAHKFQTDPHYNISMPHKE